MMSSDRMTKIDDNFDEEIVFDWFNDWNYFKIIKKIIWETPEPS